ncbi:hypothetical protein TW81_14965 [Vibrio galatheae]|uniref:DUF2867 domain-containing protein n=1 Tax=Vibrio galatheae TaxID=579748 RepID=A0A0F4NG89_9VIBR|nr:DUF2867 domain-containing protein [Vibrio galatheae]KJY82142.1 hypothetical protein TW81_14965 [Vibrio galatheae]
MNIPHNALIHSYLDGAYFADTHNIELPYQGESALEIYITTMKKTPNWVNTLMDVRNRIVSKLGLKHLGSLADVDKDKALDDYQVGDQIGIFSIVSIEPNELVVEDCDKHLNVRLSFLIVPKGDRMVLHATTVVDVKNTLGKVYMFFVAPVHRRIVPTSLKTLLPA